MKIFKISLVLLISTITFSCQQNDNARDEYAHEETINQVEEALTETPVLDLDSFVNFVNENRAKIENAVAVPVEIATESLRAKISQKWEKIHFYLLEGEVVRIKTYPYQNISARTEEFYLSEGALILAVVEDNGESDRGKSLEEFDKAYYFYQGEIVKEIHSENENEYGIKDSDGEELLSEVQEYLDIYSAQTK